MPGTYFIAPFSIEAGFCASDDRTIAKARRAMEEGRYILLRGF
jgi:hypothetical protein